MKTVVYLSNQTVKVVTGEVKRNRIMVERVFREDVPRLSIVNGQATDDLRFTEFLGSFWERHKLPRDKVYLVVSSTQTVIRLFQLPPMSHRKMMGYLPREFADVERMREPVYGYSVLGKGKPEPMLRMFGVMMEQKFLREHLERFGRLGINLVSVETELTAKLHLLGSLERLKGKTCGIVAVDGAMVLSVLWVGGTFLHFHQCRLSGKRTAEERARVCAGEISALIQLASSQRLEGEIREVYLGGLEDEAFAVCNTLCCQENPGLTLLHLMDGAGDGVSFPGGAVEFGSFGAAVGGLLARRGKGNLFHQYRSLGKFKGKGRTAAGLFVPAFLVLAVLLPVLLAQALNWFRLAGRMDSCLDGLSDPQMLAGAARYERIAAENIRLRSQIEEAMEARAALCACPVMDTRVKDAVDRCARGLVTAKVTGFSAKEGVVRISSRSENASAIHAFVGNLAEEKDLFSRVDYTGFEYVEKEQAWKLYVECYVHTKKEGDRQ